MDMSLSKFWEIVKDREAWHVAVHEVAKSWTQMSNWTTTKCVSKWHRHSENKWPKKCQLGRKIKVTEPHFYSFPFWTQNSYLVREIASPFYKLFRHKTPREVSACLLLEKNVQRVHQMLIPTDPFPTPTPNQCDNVRMTQLIYLSVWGVGGQHLSKTMLIQKPGLEFYFVALSFTSLENLNIMANTSFRAQQ